MGSTGSSLVSHDKFEHDLDPAIILVDMANGPIGSIGLWVKTGHFKRVKKQVGSGYLFFHMNLKKKKKKKKKKKNMYFSFRKLGNKVLDDVKCITLNSPLIQ